MDCLGRYVPDVKAKGFIEVDELIKFDPYMHLDREFLQRLYQPDKQDHSLTEDLLLDFSLYYRDKAKEFENILLDDRVHRRYVSQSDAETWLYVNYIP